MSGQLDLDIANKKSWSLAAKVAFQRQRNVDGAEHRLAYRPIDSFDRIFKWFEGQPR